MRDPLTAVLPRPRDQQSWRTTVAAFLVGVWRSIQWLVGSLTPSRNGVLARQAAGTVRRARALAGWVSVDRLIYPDLADTIQTGIELLPAAFGLRGTSYKRHFRAAVILMPVAISTALLSFGATIGAVAILAASALIAIARTIPAANSAWQDTTRSLGLTDDYDIPGWERD
jgi:hypothetical protein